MLRGFGILCLSFLFTHSLSVNMWNLFLDRTIFLGLFVTFSIKKGRSNLRSFLCLPVKSLVKF